MASVEHVKVVHRAAGGDEGREAPPQVAGGPHGGTLREAIEPLLILPDRAGFILRVRVRANASVHIAGSPREMGPSTKVVQSQPLHVSIVLLACAPWHIIQGSPATTHTQTLSGTAYG